MALQPSKAAERPVMSTWTALDQIELLIAVIRLNTNRLEASLTTAKADPEAIRRHARMIVVAAEATERARIDLERSVER